MNIKIPSELNGQPIPQPIELNSYEMWVMKQWEEVGRSRLNSESGQQPISDGQILSYITLMDEDLRHIDIQMIKSIDKGFISELANQRDLQREE